VIGNPLSTWRSQLRVDVTPCSIPYNSDSSSLAAAEKVCGAGTGCCFCCGNFLGCSALRFSALAARNIGVLEEFEVVITPKHDRCKAYVWDIIFITD